MPYSKFYTTYAYIHLVENLNSKPPGMKSKSTIDGIECQINLELPSAIRRENPPEKIYDERMPISLYAYFILCGKMQFQID